MATTHYRDETVAVTSTFIQVENKVYQFSELEYVWHKSASPDWRVRGRTAGRGVLNFFMMIAGIIGFIIVVAFVAAAVGESRVESALGHAGVPRNTLLLVAVVFLLLAFAPLIWEWALNRVDDSYTKGEVIYEMWAIRDGKELLLLRIDDATRFGKIYRSVQRVLEQR